MKNGYLIDPSRLILPTTPKTRIEANIAALKLSQELASSGNPASREQMDVLARFSGWGAHKEVLNSEQAAQRGSYLGGLPTHQSWEEKYGAYYDEFRSLLDDEEFRAAEIASLNSHFTSEMIAGELWSIAENAGFAGGLVMEPAIGHGMILGTMPRNLRDKVSVIGCDPEPISARIASQLYPDAKVLRSYFEDLDLPDDVDLVITNVPFSDVEPPTNLNRDRLNLHNFMIARSMELLRPGGLGVFITSSATLENRPRDRKILAEKGDLIHAIRLPNNAFKSSANTEVVTDILVFSRPRLIKIAMPEPFLGKRTVKVAEDDASEYYDSNKGSFVKVTETEVNEYFVNHPENLLGKHGTNGKMYGRTNTEKGQYTVHGSGNLEEQLVEAVGRVPRVMEVTVSESLSIADRAEQAMTQALAKFSAQKKGEHIISPVSGEISVVGGQIANPWWNWDDNAIKDAKLSYPRGWRKDRIVDAAPRLLRLRERYRKQIALEVEDASDSEIEAHRDLLREDYETIVERYGPLSKIPTERIFFGDPDADLIKGLELVREVPGNRPGERKEQFEAAKILTMRVLSGRPELPENPTLEEAAFYVKNLFGSVDPESIRELLGRRVGEADAVREELLSSGKFFFDPELGEIVTASNYLSGDLPRKLEIARERELTRNIEAITAIFPEPVPFSRIRAPLGSNFVPAEFYGQFAQEILDSDQSFEFDEGMNVWQISRMGSVGHAALVDFGTEDFNGIELLEKALNGRAPKVFDRIQNSDGSISSIINVKETRAAEQKQRAIRTAWADWVGRTEERRETIEINYNGISNRINVPEYDGSSLTLPGLRRGADALKPRPKQLNATMRFIEEQRGLLAHDVGFGKTLTMIMTAMESKRLGLAKKPMIVCDNASYPSFIEAVRDAYPAANILCSTKDMVNDRNRGTFLAQIASSDVDIVMMQRSHFERLPNDPEEVNRFFDEQLALLEPSIEEGPARKQRACAKEKERLMKKCRQMRERVSKSVDDGHLTWDQLGVDLLIVDEAHKEKKPFFMTKSDRIKGLDPTASNRATNLLLKARTIQRRRGGGKGVILATATPISNTVAEIYNMARICDPQLLARMGCSRFDAFRSTFCEARTEIELHEATGKWRMETRLSKFFNGPLLVKAIRSFADIENDPVVAGIKVPDMRSGGPKMVITPLSESGYDLMERISAIYEEYEEMDPESKREMSHLPLVLMQAAVSGAADPRLIDPSYEDDPLSPTNVAMGMVAETWLRESDKKGVQVIFADRRRSMNLECIGGLDKGAALSTKLEVFEGGEPDGNPDEEDNSNASPERFDWHHEMRDKLVAKGIPENEIVIVSDLKDDPKVRKDLMAKLNDGVVRVVIGSTEKVGTGLNFQRRLCAAWHMDAPRDFSSSALTQRNGRIIRSGNTYPEVDVYYVGMEDSAMSGVFHRIQRKEVMSKQALSGKGVGVEFEDLAAMDLENMKSSLVSDTRVLQRAELLAEIKDIREAKEMHNDEVVRITSRISQLHSSCAFIETAKLPNYERVAEWAKPKVFSDGFDSKVYVNAKVSGGRHEEMLDEDATLEGEIFLDDFRKWMNATYKASGNTVDFELQFALGPNSENLSKWRYGYQTKSEWSGKFRLALESRDREISDVRINTSTGKGVISGIAETLTELSLRPERTRQHLIESAQTIEKLKHSREQKGAFKGGEKLQRLEGELDALEIDLNVNPAKRKLRQVGDRTVKILPVIGESNEIIESFEVEVEGSPLPEPEPVRQPEAEVPGPAVVVKPELTPAEVEVDATLFVSQIFRVSRL